MFSGPFLAAYVSFLKLALLMQYWASIVLLIHPATYLKRPPLVCATFSLRGWTEAQKRLFFACSLFSIQWSRKFFWKARWTPLRDHPPPKPPSSAPIRTKRVPICSFLNRHPSAYSSRPETKVLQSFGAKTEIRTPVHT